MRHRLISFSLLAVCSFALLTASNGCSGSGSPDAGKSEVSGTVTIDGATPPVGTTISFDSKDGKLAGDTKPVDSGKYSIRVVAGAYKVRRAGRARCRRGSRFDGSWIPLHVEIPGQRYRRRARRGNVLSFRSRFRKRNPRTCSSRCGKSRAPAQTPSRRGGRGNA